MLAPPLPRLTVDCLAVDSRDAIVVGGHTCHAEHHLWAAMLTP